MKKCLFTFIAFLMAMSCMAQEHLTFKGIPIEGSMTTFCQKLKAKGFTQTYIENNTTYFIGDFTGSEAWVGVNATDDGQNVFSVMVFFNSSENWNFLENTYKYYKDLYTRKYGVPFKCKENNPSSSERNTSKMLSLENGTTTWYTGWELKTGIIKLSIEKSNEILRGLVVIRYQDSQNVKAKIQKDLEDI